MEWLIGFISLGVLYVVIVTISLFRRRTDEEQEKLEEFSGVLDVKREVKNKLDTDLDYVNKLHDTFNDK